MELDPREGADRPSVRVGREILDRRLRPSDGVYVGPQFHLDQ
jgi:hypothetical protein